MPTLNDLAHAQYSANSGASGSLNDVEVAYLQQVTGLTTNDIDDLWYAQMIALGYGPATIQDMQFEYWGDLGHTGSWNDRYFAWLSDGGAFGPNVTIVDNKDPSSCNFQPPTTTDCAASGTYTANDTGFTNPADTWLWTIEPPVVGVNLTNATAKTCTVSTDADSDDVAFNLKVVATDSVSTDTANRTTAFTQDRIDTNVLPVFIGPDINNVIFAQGVDIGAFDFSVLFTGTNLVYAVVGSLPAGLNFDTATGILTGTPTGLENENLSITATNSKGVATSNTFNMQITNQAQQLSVNESVAGSCTWEDPATTCQADGTYVAVDTGWTSAPTSYVWSVTVGSATIISGQGTDTVVVRTDGGSNVTFSLKCVASNAGPEQAENVSQFTHSHAEAASGPAFHALTPDPLTYEMKGVLTGTGGLTTTHTADLYTPDFEGVYRKFAANEPVWAGGRVVTQRAAETQNLSLNGQWNKNLVTTTYPFPDPDGGNTASRIEAIGASAYIRQTPTAELTSLWNSTFWVRRIVGTGTIEMQVPDVTTLDITAIIADGQWHRITTQSAPRSNGLVYHQINIATSGDVIDLWHPLLEEVTGQTNQNPGEYVENTGVFGTFATQAFANANGNTVLNNVVTEAVGLPFAEAPYLQYYPAAQNDHPYSSDMTAAGWLQQTSVITSYDQIGLTGEPNTASLVDDQNAAGTSNIRVTPNITIPAAVQDITLKIWVKKDSDETRFPNFEIQTITGTFFRWAGQINLNTGAVALFNDNTPATIESIDAGDWWILMTSAAVDATNVDLRTTFSPAFSTTLGGSGQNAATGAITLGNVEVHIGKTIAEVRGLGPIFTTTAAVATDKVICEYDNSNHDTAKGAYYLEYEAQIANSESIGSGQNVLLALNTAIGSLLYTMPTSGGRIQGAHNGGNGTSFVASVNSVADKVKLANVYSDVDGKFTINADGAYGTEIVTFVESASNIMKAPYDLNTRFPSKIRNLQRHDIASFQEGKDIIDALMTDAPAFVGGVVDLTIEDES
jgi:hypothetical protein